MRTDLQRDEEGIVVNDKVLNNLSYADDTTLIAKSEEKLPGWILERITIERNNLSQEINVDKTKFILIDGSNAVWLHNLLRNIERVNNKQWGT